MKTLILIFSISFVPLTIAMHNLSTEEDSAYQTLLRVYADGAKSQFQANTREFLERYPHAPDSMVLQRYINEFVKNAVMYRYPGQPMHIIGREYRTAQQTTPKDGAQLDYILSGVENRGCSGTLWGMAPDVWKDHLKQIENRIAQKE